MINRRLVSFSRSPSTSGFHCALISVRSPPPSHSLPQHLRLPTLPLNLPPSILYFSDQTPSLPSVSGLQSTCGQAPPSFQTALVRLSVPTENWLLWLSDFSLPLWVCGHCINERLWSLEIHQWWWALSSFFTTKPSRSKALDLMQGTLTLPWKKLDFFFFFGEGGVFVENRSSSWF